MEILSSPRALYPVFRKPESYESVQYKREDKHRKGQNTMISKNKDKEEDQSSEENELCYERIEESSRMGFIAFYTALNDEKQQEYWKKKKTDSGVYLCVLSCQQPKRIDNAETKKNAAS